MSARVWSLAGAASVLLHGAGLAGIALATRPEPAPDQQLPESRFSIEAAEVPRSRAEPEVPKADALAESAAPATTAEGGTVPHSRAEPAVPVTEPLSATAPAAQPVAAQAGHGAATAPVQAKPTPVRAETAGAAALAALSAPGASAASLQPPAVAVRLVAPAAQASAALSPEIMPVSARPAPATQAAPVSATTPAQPALAPAPARVGAQRTSAPAAVSVSPPAPPQPTLAPVAARLGVQAASAPVVAGVVPSAPSQATLAPTAKTAVAAAPEAPASESLPLPATAGTASLAWSGSEDAPVSATSLAAIAAFTRAGDPGAQAAQVRDGIAGLLASVPCARLQTTFIPETGQLELRGHIPEDALRGPVLAALREQVGDAIPLSDQLLILPRPQCGALAGIASLGLPQSTEQLSNPAVIGDDGFARNTTYVEGERFYLEMTGADYDAYLYVDYFDKEGNVIHLQPNEYVPLELVAADAEVLVAKPQDGKSALELTIAAPFGQEIAAAFAASHPLYEDARPLVEPADAYLAFLKERVAEARAAHDDFKGEWVYFFITTKER